MKFGRIISQPCDLAFQNCSKPGSQGQRGSCNSIQRLMYGERDHLLLEMLDTAVEIGSELEFNIDMIASISLI